MCGFARTTWQFFVARVGVGVGEAGGTPGANSLLSDYFPATRRAMALTVFSLGAPIGAWLGYNVAGTIADHYGWRAVFYALGVPGVLAGLAVWLTVREPRARLPRQRRRRRRRPRLWTTMRFLWSQRSAVHVMIGERPVRAVGLGSDVLDTGVPAAHLPHDASVRRATSPERAPRGAAHSRPWRPGG